MNNQNKQFEFVTYYERKLAEWMDPFRRCRAGEFDGKELESCLIEAFMAFGSEKQKEKMDMLLYKTNNLLESYYRGTKKDIAISPDVFAHRREVEEEIKKLKEISSKKLAL